MSFNSWKKYIQLHEIATVIILILQTEVLRHRKVKWLTIVTDSKWAGTRDQPVWVRSPGLNVCLCKRAVHVRGRSQALHLLRGTVHHGASSQREGAPAALHWGFSLHATFPLPQLGGQGLFIHLFMAYFLLLDLSLLTFSLVLWNYSTPFHMELVTPDPVHP